MLANNDQLTFGTLQVLILAPAYMHGLIWPDQAAALTVII